MIVSGLRIAFIPPFLIRWMRVNVDLDAPQSHPPAVYDLIANVTHESATGTTRDKDSIIWKVHVRAGAGGGDNEKWFQIQDLIVEEIRKEMIFLGETVLQVSDVFGEVSDGKTC